MQHTLLTIIGLLPTLMFGQWDWAEPSGKPYVYYYPFYDSIQMVEIDHLTAYNERVSFLETTQPRALTWAMVLGPPLENAYLFRHMDGAIVKQIGYHDATTLLSVEQCRPLIRPHRGIEVMYGEFRFYSTAGTRYAPYYLIGQSDRSGNGNLGLIDSLGNIVLPQQYDLIQPSGHQFITSQDDRMELLSHDLQVQFSSQEHKIWPSQYHDQCIDVMCGDAYGLMDSTGKFIVPCRYDRIVMAYFPNGLARVEKNNLVGFVDRSGKLVIDCSFQNAGYFSDGLCNVRHDEKWGYINEQGKVVIPHQYTIGLAFSEGYARVAIQEKGIYHFGFINTKGDVVIPLQYENAKDFQNGIAEVMVDGKWIRIDTKGVLLR